MPFRPRSTLPRHARAARSIFSTALQNASIDCAFARHVHCNRGILRICDDLYDLNSYSRVLVVSIGKAAHAMTAALEAHVGSRLEGIVAASVEPANQIRGFRYFHGGHPTPNAESIRAAEAILKSLRALDSASLVIFMMSRRRLVHRRKAILTYEISLPDLVVTYRALVLSGAPIAEINAIRKHLSAVKGGRLAQAAYPAQQVSILVSDVPDSTPDALASGPTMPDLHQHLRLRAHRRKIRSAHAVPDLDRRSLPSTRARRSAQIRRPGFYSRALVDQFSPTKLPSTKPPPPPKQPASPSRSTTPATTGTTKKPPTIF